MVIRVFVAHNADTFSNNSFGMLTNESITTKISPHLHLFTIFECIVLIALSRCNRVFTRRLRLCHSHTVYRREVRKGDREGPNRLESEV